MTAPAFHGRSNSIAKGRGFARRSIMALFASRVRLCRGRRLPLVDVRHSALANIIETRIPLVDMTATVFSRRSASGVSVTI